MKTLKIKYAIIIGILLVIVVLVYLFWADIKKLFEKNEESPKPLPTPVKNKPTAHKDADIPSAIVPAALQREPESSDIGKPVYAAKDVLLTYYDTKKAKFLPAYTKKKGEYIGRLQKIGSLLQIHSITHDSVFTSSINVIIK